MDQIVKVDNGCIVVAEDVMHQLQDFQVMQQRMKNLEEEMREALMIAMRDNGIKTFENEFCRITYKEPSVSKRVDTKALKECGLYDSFTKDSITKESVVITWKN